ncbi:MAG TPA: outer membrane lipoprotein carrier protein LolA [Candidatus Angelobacter sp.]|nr:outer membrane lipoprotein carrier protein LolA [Candidatus Angelobacter sp.]
MRHKASFSQLTLPQIMLSLVCLLLAAAPGFARNAKKAKPGQAAAPDGASSGGGNLQAVLARMNQTSQGFKSAQGDFEFETYQKLVDEKDTQKGRIYFRKNKSGVDAAFDIEGPAPKQVVYTDGKLRIFEKKINQVTERTVGKNKSDVEAFLSLGFGATGNDLARDYGVKLDGWETVDGVQTAKLDLTPKNEKLLQTYNKILLWIDPERDILLKQQFFERSGDYRLAHYTNMKLNQKVPEEVFRLKTNGNTKIVTPQ